ncbi:ECF transporter S component [Clostridium sp. MB40-C1]|uniref:ECF transporter S component n=1 Tax=Clostridium sp. MB40-C1 TaxID=3070996 RepID=UPI0027E1353E|nr:ECF transporter S component [Clostridium sp. MB40-C1]WMJ80582.1 ECF transporter S component [Clostridium sp. MB40-C1]
MEGHSKNVTVGFKGTRGVIQVGIMAAITYVATFMFHIPSFMGVVHLGDCMVLLGAIVLGKKKGAISAAIGMSLFDILAGYTQWAPFTFIIKGSMAYIAASVAYRRGYKGENMWNNLVAFCIAGIFMIVAYYISGAVIARFLMVSTATLKDALIIAIKDIPGNISQATAGILIGLPLSISVKKALKRANINL